MKDLKQRIDEIHDMKAIPHFHRIRVAIETAAPETAEDLDWIAAKFESLCRETCGQKTTIDGLRRSLDRKKYGH